MEPGGTESHTDPEIITDGQCSWKIMIKLHSQRGIKKYGYNKECEESNEKAEQDPGHKRQFQEIIFYSLINIIDHVSRSIL
jgi:hypothetical protein